MQIRKILCLIIALAVLTSFAACGGASSGDSTKADETTTAAAQETEKEEPKPKIKWLGLYFANLNAGQGNFIEKAIQEITGYEVEYHMLPQENSSEKLMLDLSSGEEYDIIRLGKEDFAKLVDQKALLPLDDLIKTNAPTVFDIRKLDHPSWEAVTREGTIYALPFINNPEVIQASILYRADIFKKIGVNVPQTAAEFYEAAKKMKNMDNFIPLTGSKLPSVNFIPIIGSAFGISTWEEVDGQLVPPAMNPRMKEYLAYLNKLYTEGLLDMEFPVNKRGTAQEKFTGGKAGMFQYRWWEYGMLDNTVKNVPEAELAFMAPLKDESGRQEMESMLEVVRYVVIPKASKNAEHSMKFINALTSVEAQKKICIGDEGVHYKTEGEKFVPINPAFENDISKSFWYIPIDNLDIYPKMETEAHYAGTPHLSESYDNCTARNLSIAKRNPFGFVPPFKSQAQYGAAIDTAIVDNFIKIVAGAEPIDKYDEYISHWKQDGGDKILQEVNEWYKDKK